MKSKLYFLMVGFSIWSVLLTVNFQVHPVNGQTFAMWNRTYGGTADENCFSMVQADDGGFTLVGSTYSFGVNDADIWLVKTDSNGNMEWNRTFGSDGYDIARDLMLTDDGYIILGETTSFGAGEGDVWLIKTNSAGDMLWNRTYGGAGGERGWKIIETSDGGYAVAGITNSYGQGGNDYWLFKIDSTGTLQWNTTFGGTDDDRARGVIETVDSGFLLIGWSSSYGAGGLDYWLVKTDPDGNHEWNQTYGGTENERATAIISTNDGGYLLVGNSVSFGQGETDVYLVKIDNTGNNVWNQTYGGAAAETPFSIIKTTDGGYGIAGRTYSYGAGEDDFWFIKIDSTGTLLINQTYGGELSETSHTLIQSADGGYAMAGSTSSFGQGGTDFWLIKTRARSNISCLVSLSEFELGSQVTVSGSIVPAAADVTVTLTYTKPDATTSERTVSTLSDGSFSDTYTPDSTGSWKIQASWEGDLTHLGATSELETFIVNEKAGIPWTLYGSATVVAAVIIILLYIFVFKKKTKF